MKALLFGSFGGPEVLQYRELPDPAVLPGHVQLAMRRNCNDIMLNLPGGGQAPALPESCSLDLSPGDLERAARQLAAVPELDQDLTRLIGDIDQKLGQFDRASRAAARLRTRLETN